MLSNFLRPAWTEACQASLSFTISQSLLKLMSIESMMLSNHIILCCPLLLLPSIFPSISVFLMSWLFKSGDQSIRASASRWSQVDAHSNPTCHYEILGIPLCRPGPQEDSGRASDFHTHVSPRPPPSVPGTPTSSVNTHACITPKGLGSCW